LGFFVLLFGIINLSEFGVTGRSYATELLARGVELIREGDFKEREVVVDVHGGIMDGGKLKFFVINHAVIGYDPDREITVFIKAGEPDRDKMECMILPEKYSISRCSLLRTGK
jgi:hypothetical protein